VSYHYATYEPATLNPDETMLRWAVAQAVRMIDPTLVMALRAAKASRMPSKAAQSLLWPIPENVVGQAQRGA
jgi:hypothetical protein